MKKRILNSAIAILLGISCFCTPAFAADCEIISEDPESGVTIYRDSGGGIVFSGLPTNYVASKSEQQSQLSAISRYESELDRMEIPSTRGGENYVDYENNPIYIGTWGGVDAYARHTLGTYNSAKKHLISYGYVTYYNEKGNTAVPYRNGNATAPGQDVVDVAKFSNFSIRDLTTDNSMTLQITDWGPNQQQFGNADGRERIADLDKNDFKTLHGNTSAGVFYGRTWVPITNYNP